MQIFCPFPQYLAENPHLIPENLESAFGLLDTRRLCNQVYKETYTLIRGGWKNHPASRFPKSFMRWHAQMCLLELGRREAIDLNKLIWWQIEYREDEHEVEFPGNLPQIAESHRIALTRKLWIEANEANWKDSKQKLEARFRLKSYADNLESIYCATRYVWPQ